MDPTATVREIVELADEIIENEEDQETRSRTERAVSSYSDSLKLAELVLSLHHWMQGFGHMPQQWSAKP